MTYNFEDQGGSYQMDALISRFEEMIKNSKEFFFDVQDFEDIIDYYLERSDFSNCQKAIEAAKNQHPSCTAFKFKQALYLISINKHNDSLNILNELEILEPSNPEIYLTKGVIYSHQKKYDLSINAYKMAIKFADDPEDIYTNIAFEYENIGDYLRAINYLKKVLEINPENEAIIYELSFCYELSGQSEECVEFYENFIDKNPYSKSAWFNLGIAFSNIDKYEKAIDAYDFCLAIDETFASAYFNKANALAHLKR